MNSSRLSIVIAVILVVLGSGCNFTTQIQHNKAQRIKHYEAIIVPGFPYFEHEVNINFILRMRVIWAYHLMQEGIAENVIFSGDAVHTPYIEAEIMAQYARSLGIPANHIFVERRAEHSTENLFYGYAKAMELGFKNIAVATDPLQSRLIKVNTLQDKLPVAFIPARFNLIMDIYQELRPVLEDPCLAHIENFIPLSDRFSENELRLGAQGERFRKRYRLGRVTPLDLEHINFQKQQ